MTIITVYGEVLSPPVRTVLVTAKALGITVNLKHVELAKEEHMMPEFRKVNPAHTIPTLDDNGYIIWESRAIITYLVGRYGKDDKLYPKEIAARGKVDNMLYYEATSVYAAILNAYAHMWTEGKAEDLIAIGIMAEKLATLDIILAPQKFAAGSKFTLADISLLCSLSLAHSARFSFEKYPNILKWEERAKAEMPFYDQVAGEGIKQLDDYFQKKP